MHGSHLLNMYIHIHSVCIMYMALIHKEIKEINDIIYLLFYVVYKYDILFVINGIPFKNR